MKKWRLAAIAAFLGGIPFAWLALAAPSPVEPRVNATPEPRKAALEARAQGLVSEIARLHERPRQPEAVLTPSRNLFEFERTPPPSHPALVAKLPATVPSVPAAVSVPAPRPPLNLIGVVEDPARDSAPSAVISGVGGPFVVKAGETIAIGGAAYRIADVTPSYADVLSADGSATFRLTLK